MTKSPNSEGDPSPDSRPSESPVAPWRPHSPHSADPIRELTFLNRFCNLCNGPSARYTHLLAQPDCTTAVHAQRSVCTPTHATRNVLLDPGTYMPSHCCTRHSPPGRCSHVVTEAPERIALEQPHSCLMHPRPLHALEMSLPTTHRGPLQTQAVSFPLLFTSTPCSLHDTFSLPEILRLHIWVCIQCPFRRESRPRRRIRRTNSSHLPRSNTAFRTGYGRPQKTSVVQGVTPDPAGGHQQEPI